MSGSIAPLTTLRFFAAIYVLFFHSGTTFLSGLGIVPTYFDNFGLNGYLGVSFFFILSGFILAHVYASKLYTKGVVRSYAVARFARVYPVYFLSLILLIPIAKSSTLAAATPQFFLLQSWLPLNSQILDNWNMQAWTLSVEFLFYLLFLPILSTIMRLRSATVISLLAAACLVTLAFRLPAIRGTGELLTEEMGYVPIPLLRLPEFVYGVCLGILYERKYLSLGADANRISVLLIAIIISVLGCSKSLWIAPIAAVLLGLLIFIVASDSSHGWLTRCLSNETMVFLGGASYSIYILQSPVREWLRIFFPDRLELVGRMLYYPILISFSVIVFLFFEEVIRKYLRNVLATHAHERGLTPSASFAPMPAVRSSGVVSDTISDGPRAPHPGE
jgi:peptidoglycan/LPS O-acetylase OafA/YrhL